jgi:hypothetical protein
MKTLKEGLRHAFQLFIPLLKIITFVRHFKPDFATRIPKRNTFSSLLERTRCWGVPKITLQGMAFIEAARIQDPPMKLIAGPVEYWLPTVPLLAVIRTCW